MSLRILLASAVLAAPTLAADPDPVKAKKGLQDLAEFIGTWNLAADSKATGKLVSWKETVSFSWKFKGDDTWLSFESKDGKLPAKGELRYDPEKKVYTLKAEDKEKKTTTYTGTFKKGKLVFEATDEKSKDVSRITLNTLSEGVRMNVVSEVQKGGSGPFETAFKAVGNKDGESFAGGGGGKKPECIVTGGTATMTVSYMGKTYYVCCTGCRDEFNENPKKYVDAYEKSKK